MQLTSALEAGQGEHVHMKEPETIWNGEEQR